MENKKDTIMDKSLDKSLDNPLDKSLDKPKKSSTKLRCHQCSNNSSKIS
jgi:cytochrome c-type biogenesis protein CcmH/NrfF